MSIDSDLPASGWIASTLLAIGTALYSVFYFVTNTRSSIALHSKRLDKLETDLSSHMERVENKLDRLIFHVGGLRGDT